MRKKANKSAPRTTPSTDIPSVQVPKYEDNLNQMKQVFIFSSPITQTHLTFDVNYLIGEDSFPNRSQIPQPNFKPLLKPTKATSLEVLQFITNKRPINRKQGTLVINHDFFLLYADKHAMDLMGVPKTRLHKQNFMDLVYAEDKEKFLKNLDLGRMNPRHEFNFLIYFNNRSRRLLGAQQFEKPSNEDYYFRYLKGIKSKIVEINLDVLQYQKYKKCFINTTLINLNRSNYYALRMTVGIPPNLSQYKFSNDPVLKKTQKKTTAKIQKKRNCKNYPKIKGKMQVHVTRIEIKQQQQTLKEQKKRAMRALKRENNRKTTRRGLIPINQTKQLGKNLTPNYLSKKKKIAKQHQRNIRKALRSNRHVRHVQIAQDKRETKRGHTQLQIEEEMISSTKAPTSTIPPTNKRKKTLKKESDNSLEQPRKLSFEQTGMTGTTGKQSLFGGQEFEASLTTPDYYKLSQLTDQYFDQMLEDYMIKKVPIKEPILTQHDDDYDAWLRNDQAEPVSVPPTQAPATVCRRKIRRF